MSVGLVLGAGGAVGWVYHLGVLEGVRRALDVDPAQAQRIVGTSAGGAIAAGLMAGATNDEILTAATTRPSEQEMVVMREAAASFRRPWRWLRPIAPSLAVTAARHIGLGGLVGLLPAGVFPTMTLRRFPNDQANGWPESLWIPSVRIDDGRMVVFGRDRTDVAVIDAVEATAAVPAMFIPKRIGAARFVDGAVRSATNADLLIGSGHETVLVSSPMTRPGRGPVKIRARRQLAKEVDALRADGARVVVVEPDEDIMAIAEGFPRSNPEAGAAVIEAAAVQTVAALTSSTS